MKTYGECQRTGFRVPVDRLVKDGYHPGVTVDSSYYDPPHPQEQPLPFNSEKHQVPAPELSKPAGEGEPAPALTFDALGYPVFQE